MSWMSLQFKFQCELALHMHLIAVKKVSRMVESVENHRVAFEAALNMLVLAWLLSRKSVEKPCVELTS